MGKMERLMRLLISSPTESPVFNPWYEQDQENGIGERGPAIRRVHLERYLDHRLGAARWLLIGEAVGYQGGHFSGLAMTSERIILGHKEQDGIPAAAVYPAIEPRRTSRAGLKAKGFSEPTATIVWKSLLGGGLAPEDFVLWNAFAWHPYDPEVGLLSNRRPSSLEQSISVPALEAMLDLFSAAELIAVGRVAEGQLQGLGLKPRRVRHPAHGGATKFREQMREVTAAH